MILSFQLTSEEKTEVVTNCDHLARLRFSPTLPYAFTEYGAIQTANMLNSPRAVDMSLFVVRAFVRLRQLLASHTELARKLAEVRQIPRRFILGPCRPPFLVSVNNPVFQHKLPG